MKKPLPEVSITNLFEHYGARIVGPDRSEWRKATCPLHDDKNASASVNEDEGKWSCFTCDEHGDVFDLIFRMEPSVTGFPGAVAFAEEFVGAGNGHVRETHRTSSLLPGRKGDRQNRGHFRPPWTRL